MDNIKHDEKPFDKHRLYHLRNLAKEKGLDVFVGNTDSMMPSPYKKDAGKKKYVKVHAFAITKNGEFVAGLDSYAVDERGKNVVYCNMTLDDVEQYLNEL